MKILTDSEAMMQKARSMALFHYSQNKNHLDTFNQLEAIVNTCSLTDAKTVIYLNSIVANGLINCCEFVCAGFSPTIIRTVRILWLCASCTDKGDIEMISKDALASYVYLTIANWYISHMKNMSVQEKTALARMKINANRIADAWLS